MVTSCSAAILWLACHASLGDALEPRWKLGWADLVHYSPYDLSNGPARDSQARNAGLFGYEIENGRVYHPRLHDWREIPLILGFTLPPRALEPGKRVVLDIKLDRGANYQSLVARGWAKRSEDPNVVSWTLHYDLDPMNGTVHAWQERYDGGSFDATVEFDEARGLVKKLQFQFQLDLPGRQRDGAAIGPALHEELRFSKVVPADVADLGNTVDKTLDRAITWLWSNREKDGVWPAQRGPVARHESGLTALCTLAILKGSTDRTDLRAQGAIEWLLAQRRQHVYDTSLAMLALEAWYAPADAPRGARGEDAPISGVSDEHREWMQASAEWLASHGDDGWWAYPTAEKDMSNTQFAVLGLLAASRFGVFIGDEAMVDVIERYVANQARTGRTEKFSLATGSDAGKTGPEVSAEARGWTYYAKNEIHPYYSTVTAAGVASLSILDSILRGRTKAAYPPMLQNAVKTSIRDGWAWLHDSWNMRFDDVFEWDMVWLYTLMRAAVLCDVTLVGQHDWYREGARWLVATQNTDGAWTFSKSRVVDTALAVLFLRRATIRIATRGR